MKSFSWLLAGVTLGVAAYVVLNQPGPRYTTGSDDIEDAAADTTLWGSKRRLSGTGNSLVGKVKQGVGRATGNQDLAGEGVVDQAAGALEDAAGQAAHAVGQTIHDLNR